MLRPRLAITGIRREAWILLGGNFLDNVGLGLFFPILPLYITAHGGSALLVGIVGASALLGNVIAQAPGGWLADRFSRRNVVATSIFVYGLAFLVYLLPMPVEVLVAIRFFHAVVGGFYQPAARALLADLTPADRRGAAFGQWQASNMAGFLVGPMLGGLLAAVDVGLVFVAAGVACLLGAILSLTLPSVRVRQEHAIPAGTGPGTAPIRLLLVLLPAIIGGCAWQYLSGVYGAMWPLYMVSIHGGPIEIGLSISLFSLPVVLLSGLSGQLQDRIGPRAVVAVSLLFAAVFATGYTLTSSIPIVIGLGLIEGICTVGGLPAVMAEVSRSVDSSHQGRAQGLFATFTVAAQALGALAGGALFERAHNLPFLSISLVCLLAIAATPLLGRGQRPARGEPALARV
jgi:MFS family permease